LLIWFHAATTPLCAADRRCPRTDFDCELEVKKKARSPSPTATKQAEPGGPRPAAQRALEQARFKPALAAASRCGPRAAHPLLVRPSPLARLPPAQEPAEAVEIEGRCSKQGVNAPASAAAEVIALGLGVGATCDEEGPLPPQAPARLATCWWPRAHTYHSRHHPAVEVKTGESGFADLSYRPKDVGIYTANRHRARRSAGRPVKRAPSIREELRKRPGTHGRSAAGDASLLAGLARVPFTGGQLICAAPMPRRLPGRL